MSLGHFEIMGMVADGLQMLLITLILFLLIRQRKRSSMPEGSERPSSGAGAFRHEFLIQSLKHQTEMAFDHIEKTLQTERRELQQRYASVRQQEACRESILPEAPPEDAPFNIDAASLTDETNDEDSPYRQVLEMAADGLNPHRIAKQLSIPRGEVELVLKMSASPPSTRAGNDPAALAQPRRVAR
jgi:hypothetical protein